MTGKKDLPDISSLPEDIAAKAGLPREHDIDHSMHEISETVTHGVQSAAHRTENLADETRHSAETTAREAANTASGLGDRTADAVERTRERVRDTVDDVRTRASDAYEDARDWASDRYDHHRGRAYDLADRGYVRVDRARNATQDFVADNPLLVGIVGLAAGLLLGSLIPRTRQETATLGLWADDVRDQGLRYARDATRQGRAFVERALDPDNLDEAAKRAKDEAEDDRGSERTAHRL